MRVNLVGALVRNAPFATEIAFKKGLERIGHIVTSVDTSQKNQVWDYDADATIVFKHLEREECYEDLKRCSGKKIVYQPDDLRFVLIKKMMMDMRTYCDYAFTFDDSGARLAIEYGYKDARRLLLTADDDLYKTIPGMRKDIDVSFIANLSNGPNHASRRRMVQVVKDAGFNILAGSCFDIKKVVEIYNRSKITLNHATDVGQIFGTGYGYQCRHFEAGLTKTCVLSNEVLNENVLGGFLVFNSEESLIERIEFLLSEESYRNSYAQRLYDELHESHLPQHRAAEMIKIIEEFK